MKFVCDACGAVIEGEEKPEYCPRCGGEQFTVIIDESKVARLKLVDETNGEYITVHKTETIGRDICRIFGIKYKYVSPKQFILEKMDASHWIIRGIVGVKHPTMLNGEDVTNKEVELKDGDIIEIGMMRLKVVFESNE